VTLRTTDIQGSRNQILMYIIRTLKNSLFKNSLVTFTIAAMREFNEVIGLFDFILTRNQVLNLPQANSVGLPNSKSSSGLIVHSVCCCTWSQLRVDILSGRYCRFVSSLSWQELSATCFFFFYLLIFYT
jgi:hypothetical protein